MQQREHFRNPCDKSGALLYVPSHMARSLDLDLEAAGIDKVTPAGTVDFHALRATYTTLVIERGANEKEAQTLARHSTPNLTLNVYARTREARLGELADMVGERLGFGAECSNQRATGGGWRGTRNGKP